MNQAATVISSPSVGEEIRALQSRIRQMQDTKLETRAVRTHPALEQLLPTGSLRAGAAYSVHRSSALVMALMAGPSSDGVWCGVVGLPDFGLEAASRFGVDLERLVLVPHPGDEWLTATAALADAVGVVVTTVPRRVPDSAVARLQARIRQRDAILIVLGDWPQSEATLRIEGSEWTGLGQGHGYLTGRRARVAATARGEFRTRRAELWLPDGDELFRPVEAAPPAVRPVPAAVVAVEAAPSASASASADAVRTGEAGGTHEAGRISEAGRTDEAGGTREAARAVESGRAGERVRAVPAAVVAPPSVGLRAAVRGARRRGARRRARDGGSAGPGGGGGMRRGGAVATAAPEVAVPMRTMVLWCPDWPVTAMAAVSGDDPAHPIAVVEKDLVHACSAAARAEGVRRGLRVREAQARCPQLVVLPLDQVRVDRGFEPLIAALEDLSPGVQVVRSGVCAVRSRGPARYYGSEERAAEVFLDRLSGLGAPDARVGVSDGLFAADIAARLPGGDPGTAADRIRVVPPGRAADFLAGLPVQFTGDDELTGLLVRLGVRTLGDFAAIPAEDVRARFGEVGARAHLRASGSEGTAVVPRVPPELREVVSEFEPALDRVDQITFGIRAASDRFVDDLREARLVCTAVRVELTAETGRVHERVWLHPRWFSATDVVDRVRWQLQGGAAIDSGLEAAVARVRISAEAVDASIHHETGLWGTGSDERVHHALSRVQSMVGHEGVLTAEIGGGRDLAERQRLTPWGDRPEAGGGWGTRSGGGSGAARSGAGRSGGSSRPAAGGSGASGSGASRSGAGGSGAGPTLPGTAPTSRAGQTPPWPGSLPPPLPTTVFEQRLSVLVEDVDGQVVDVTDRGEATAPPALFSPGASRSELRPVTAWAGPWPVSERWWDVEQRRSYARFQVVDADGDAWLLRVEGGRWTAEARYD